jgi:serine/threonine protein kinase
MIFQTPFIGMHQMPLPLPFSPVAPHVHALAGNPGSFGIAGIAAGRLPMPNGVFASPPTFRMPEKGGLPHRDRLAHYKSTDNKKIGQGVGGQVFSCMINGQHRIVKSMLDPGQRHMFEKEFAAFSQLGPHDNIRAPLEFAYVNGKLSMIFADDTVPSTALADRASSLPPSDQLLLLGIVIEDLFRAIAFMHKSGRVHGDIKLDNTVCSSEGNRLEVIDMGHSTTASRRDPRTGQQVLRNRSGRTGDPRYTSPELERPRLGNKALSARFTLCSVDVYAAGCVFNRLLELADAQFEKFYGQAPSAAMAARHPEVADWMQRRHRFGQMAAQMVDPDPGKRPLAESALFALTPDPASEAAGRMVLQRLMAADR